MRRRVGNQDGNVTILTFGIMIGIFAFSLILFDIYAVYMARRVAQSAADAAALGALEVLQTTASQQLDAEAHRRLDVRKQEIQDEAARRVADWERQRRAELTRRLREERDNDCPPPPAEPPAPGAPTPEPCPDYSGISDEVDRVIADERPAIRAQYFREVVRERIDQPELQNAIIQGTAPELSWLVEEFLTMRDLACVVRTAGAGSREGWEAAARHFATLNGGQSPETEFPYDGRAAIGVTVPVRMRLLVFDHLMPERLRHVRAEAAVQINRFGPFPIDVRAGC